MTLDQETRRLRARLRAWADKPEWGLLIRYELLPPKPPTEWRQRILHDADRQLQRLGLGLRRPRYRWRSWHAGLKHAPSRPGAIPLLLWSEALDREYVREACMGFKTLLQNHPEFLPVLVTDLADFAFYSRLQWLVEYLPRLGDDAVYFERKRRYLAWRYRDVPVLPLSAGLADQNEFDALILLEHAP